MEHSSSHIQYPSTHISNASAHDELNEPNYKFLYANTGWWTPNPIGEATSDLPTCPPPPPPSPCLSSFPHLASVTMATGDAGPPKILPVILTAAIARHGVQASDLHEGVTPAARYAGDILPDCLSASFTSRYPHTDNLPRSADSHPTLQNSMALPNSAADITVGGETNADLLAPVLKLYWQTRSTKLCGRAPSFGWNGKGTPNYEEQYDHVCADELRIEQCGTRGRRSDLDSAAWWINQEQR